MKENSICRIPRNSFNLIGALLIRVKYLALSWLTVVNTQSQFLRGWTIRKLMGGEAGEVQKKYSRKAKLNEKKFMHAN